MKMKSLPSSIVISIGSLDIPDIPGFIIDRNPDSVNSTIHSYASHPSILAIKARIDASIKFELTEVTEDMMIREILGLNPDKSVSGPISVKILRLTSFECASVLTSIFK